MTKTDAHETTPSDAAIAPLETRHVEAMTMQWNGIPVSVTGDVSTHFCNWKLIGYIEPKKSLAREIEQGRGVKEWPPLPEKVVFPFTWDERPRMGYTEAQIKAYGEACRRMGNRDE